MYRMYRDSGLILMKVGIMETYLESLKIDGDIPPSEWCIDTTELLLVATNRLLNDRHNIEIPVGSVVADGGGGIRVEWTRERDNIHLCIPRTHSDLFYLYWRLSGVSDLIKSPTAEILVDKINEWISGQ